MQSEPRHQGEVTKFKLKKKNEKYQKIFVSFELSICSY